MSLTNIQGGFRFDGPMGPFEQVPVHILFALKTPYFTTAMEVMGLRDATSDSRTGAFRLLFQDSMFARLHDIGDNYGTPVGTIQVNPGINWSSGGRVNNWTWVWMHRDSLSLRGIRIQGFQDYTGGGTFNLQPKASHIRVTGGFPSAAKMGQIHFLSAFSNAQFDQLVAGTLNPATLPALIDGFPMVNSLASVKGDYTISFFSTAGVLDPADNHLVASGGGGGGEPPPPPTGIRRVSGGFGW